MLSAARLEVRRNFETNRGLATGSPELSAQITHAEEVAKFLRENVVQGQAAETDGNYSMLLNLALTRSAATYATLQNSEYTNTPSEGTMRISKKERGIH